MKNKQLYIAALSILTSTLAQASLVGDLALPHETYDGGASANCVNFTGSWVGRCTTNGQSSPDQINIEQSGCETINIGGLVSEIGGTRTYSQTQGNIETTVTIATQWNEDRTQLPGHLTVVKRQVGQPGEQSGEFYTGMGMDGASLIIVAKSSQGTVVQCSYEKR